MDLPVPLIDQHNRILVSNVHPPDWVNPKPAPRYNLVVLGGGPAGLVAASAAAGLGAKVALVEKHLLGGDCLNVGCVPSKALIRSSRSAAEVRGASLLGIRIPPGAQVDFSAVMERVRRLRAQISHHDSAEHLKAQGVDLFLGEPKFLGPTAVEIANQTLRFSRALIATGARAVRLPIPGLEETGVLTNETVFNLTDRPARLAVIGAGPIGCELAQAFQRLGSQVTLLEAAPTILGREDPDAVALLHKVFQREGIQLFAGCQIKRAERQGQKKVLHYALQGKEASLEVDAILVGVGRAPNVEGLNLEAAGVQYDPKKGIQVNDTLQTTHPRIYAAGDVCMALKFTHAADFAARLVIENALFFGRRKLSRLIIPWCTYTDPEIAHVGLYEQEAREQGIPVQTFVKPLQEVDRAVVDSQEEGFVKIHVRRGTDQILGATLVAPHAGEMIGEIVLAMVSGTGLGKLSKAIHPYPTQAEAIRQLGDAYNASLLTPAVKGLLKRWFAWTR